MTLVPNGLERFCPDNQLEAGVDEAGRGCLAGPVFAAAVILPPDYHNPMLNDSKKLSAKSREYLREEIERESICWAVNSCTPLEVDKLNILWASVEAMHRALKNLPDRPDVILVDGNRFKPFQGIQSHCMIKGDGRFLSIAAASVLAKTHRDAYMDEIGKEYPHYLWHQNKGYPTRAHRLAIREHGISPYHRKSFTLMQNELPFESFTKP